jgi:hypothetical protein
MGLAENRKIKELQDVTLPEREAEIDEICGTKIPYEVDWDSFAHDLEALNFMDNLSCHRLNMALRVICMDDMGKEAVRDTVKVVRLKNVPKDDMRLAFVDDGGALEMHCAYALHTDGMWSDDAIRDELMAHL